MLPPSIIRRMMSVTPEFLIWEMEASSIINSAKSSGSSTGRLPHCTCLLCPKIHSFWVKDFSVALKFEERDSTIEARHSNALGNEMYFYHNFCLAVQSSPL